MLLSALRVRAGLCAACDLARRASLLTNSFQFTEEHEAERAVAMLQPSIFGVSLSISPARPRLPPQGAPALHDDALFGRGGEGGMDQDGDGMWEN